MPGRPGGALRGRFPHSPRVGAVLAREVVVVKLVLGAFGVLVALVLSLAVVVAGPGLNSGPPTQLALEEIPASLLPVYVNAAAGCPGLSWQVLAAIGFVESAHGAGRLDPVTGDVAPPILGPALDGTNGYARIPDASMPDGWAHALGPMQFLSTTWATWGRVAPYRPIGAAADVHNAWDAIHTAAAYLCGADLRIDDLEAAVLTYNHSQAYLGTVMAKAVEYGLGLLTGTAGFVCPVAGAVSFTDDWGAPRSGGRTHDGIDMFAPYGAPLVAAENGVIERVTNTDAGLGGITIWLNGDRGTAYYYAHNSLNAVAAGQRVRAGEVIAYLGDTGNAATSAAHLHFEIHPAGRPAVRPFGIVSAACRLPCIDLRSRMVAYVR